MEASRHTFLFADLVGFTALTEAEGDEHALQVAVTLQARVRTLLPTYRASEVKALGDALMLFGEDPANGIRLGLRIVSEVEADATLPPIRVGIHWGPAVEREGDWYGRTVNVAARLCSAAGGGQVLVSDRTLEAAGPIPEAEFGKRRLHWLRNVTEPVAARLVSERVTIGSSFVAAASRPFTIGFAQ